jgi:hypothetical protein
MVQEVETVRAMFCQKIYRLFSLLNLGTVLIIRADSPVYLTIASHLESLDDTKHALQRYRQCVLLSSLDF